MKILADFQICIRVPLSNTLATFQAQYMKKISNTESELKKSITYKKSVLLIKNGFAPYDPLFSS